MYITFEEAQHKYGVAPWQIVTVFNNLLDSYSQRHYTNDRTSVTRIDGPFCFIEERLLEPIKEEAHKQNKSVSDFIFEQIHNRYSSKDIEWFEREEKQLIDQSITNTHPDSKRHTYIVEVLRNWNILEKIQRNECLLKNKKYHTAVFMSWGDGTPFNIGDIQDIFGFDIDTLRDLLNNKGVFKKYPLTPMRHDVFVPFKHGVVRFYLADFWWLWNLSEFGKITGNFLLNKLYNENKEISDTYKERYSNPIGLKELNRKQHYEHITTQLKEIYEKYDDAMEELEWKREQSFSNLYYVKIFDKASETYFWKIGIENKAKTRWHKNSTLYSSEYLWTLTGDRGKVYDLEDKIKTQYHTGVKKNTACFMKHAGHTEALDYDFLNETKEEVESMLAV